MYSFICLKFTIQKDDLWVFILNAPSTMARWLSWLEHHTMHQRVLSSIPNQGMYLDCRLGPRSGLMGQGGNWLMFLPLMFLPLFPFLSLSNQ